VKSPVIKGSWNFAQVAPGVYRSPLSLLTNTVRNAHAALITLSSAYALGTGAYTKLNLDTASIDTASAWDNSNKYWVAPRAGNYLVVFSASYASITSSNIGLAHVYVDPGSGFVSKCRGSFSKDSGWPSNGSIVLSLNKGDKVALYGYHNYGSDRNVAAAGSVGETTFLSIAEVL